MIKFFRHIRQNLINENKFSKYIIYAIGEILLVVIGILIALQVNNWNENRKEVIKSKNYLTEFLKDLEENSKLIDKGRNVSKEYLHNETWVLDRTDYKADQADSIWMALGGHFVFWDINERTYQKIQNAGDSKLVGFDTLFDKISHYFTKSIDRYKGFQDWDKFMNLEGQTYMQDLDERLEMNNFRMDIYARETTPRKFPVAQDSIEQIKILIAFAKSPRGRNHFKYNFTRHARAIKFLDEIKSETENLIEEINQVLQERKN